MASNIKQPAAQLPFWVAKLVRDTNRENDRSRELDIYTVATLPDPTSTSRAILVSDEAGGFTMAFSDGTDWRRVQDRAIVS